MITLDQFKGMFSDLARPFSIVVTSLSAAVAPVIVVVRIAPDRLELVAAAALVGALYAGVAGLYWGKSWEKRGESKHAADVEKVRAAQGSPPPDKALAPASAAAEPEADEPDPAMYGGPRG
jgi:hypothetical protein